MSHKSSRLSDSHSLRKRAREHLEKGPITEAYGADRQEVLKLLNDALASELICVLRYKRHYYAANGINGDTVKAEFLEHAIEEQLHADRIAARIVQLGGLPDFSPDTLSKRAHSEYSEGDGLRDMVKEDLIAERIAIESYGEIIRYLGDGDPTTRRMMEEILAKEEEHAEDLQSLLQGTK
jgi:bacterioferritin